MTTPVVIRGTAGGFLLLRYLSGVRNTRGFFRSHNALFLSSPNLRFVKCHLVVCFFPVMIDELDKRYLNQVFQTTVKAEGEGLNPVN